MASQSRALSSHLAFLRSWSHFKALSSAIVARAAAARRSRLVRICLQVKKMMILGDLVMRMFFPVGGGDDDDAAAAADAVDDDGNDDNGGIAVEMVMLYVTAVTQQLLINCACRAGMPPVRAPLERGE
jgi:hypothetical protein